MRSPTTTRREPRGRYPPPTLDNGQDEDQAGSRAGVFLGREELIRLQYEEDLAERLIEGEIWEGMTWWMLFVSRGEPTRIEETPEDETKVRG